MAAQHVPTPPSPRHTQVFIPGNNRSSNHATPAVVQNIPQNIPATPLLQASDFFSSDAKESLVGKCLDNRYDIISHLTSGGMSEIYLASQRGIGQQVIIKKLHPHLYQDRNAVQRFIDEARTYAALTHPNAVKMYDLLNVNGQICIVMEYVAGKTLESYLESGYVFSVRQILDIAMQLSDALGTVHKVGIIHRDLKSENIMLMETVGERFSVKILDFGIAKITNNAQSKLTQEGAIVGTPKYMSPEQGCGRKDIDARTDIYSFGVIMYEMLCGHLPFDGESSLAILHQQIYAEVPFMNRPDNSEIPQELQKLVMKCLKKDVNERYSSFSEIVRELTEIQENRSIAALTSVPRSDENLSKTSENDVINPALLPDIPGDSVQTQSVAPAQLQALINASQPAGTPAQVPLIPAAATKPPVPPVQSANPSVSTPKRYETVQMQPYKKKSSFWLKAVIILLLLIIGGMVFIVMNDPKLKAKFFPGSAPLEQSAQEESSFEPDEKIQDVNQEAENNDFDFDLDDNSADTAAENTDNTAENAADADKPAAPKEQETVEPEQKTQATKKSHRSAADSNPNTKPQYKPAKETDEPAPKAVPDPADNKPAQNTAAPAQNTQPAQNTAAPAETKPAETKPADNAKPAVAAQEPAKPETKSDDDDEIDLEEGYDKSNEKEEAAETPKDPSQLTIGDIKVEFSFLSEFSNQALRPHIYQVLGQAQDCRWLGNTGLQFVFTNKGAGSFARFQRRFSGSADPCLIKAFEAYMRFPALEDETTTVKIVIQKK